MMLDAQKREKVLDVWQGKDVGEQIPIWLDCDTGHDDAFAILLASSCPRLKLLGVSTVHGNATLENTTKNSLSILKAVGREDVTVFPGAEKPICRKAVHAEAIHGASGLDGTTLLPEPPKLPPQLDNRAVYAIYENLSKTPPGSAWLVATGALTNIALVFSIFPSLADHIAGLSIMGGAVGGFFTHAPLGRLTNRVALAEHIHKIIPSGLPHDKELPIQEVVATFRERGLLLDDISMDDYQMHRLLEEARSSFGNTTPYAEFNIYCDPEAAASIFSFERLARKTTLIPLDVTHQVLANKQVMHLLGMDGDRGNSTPSLLRALFAEILTFFAATYEREFGMADGPPLHDPLAVAAALSPSLFDDNDGERYEVYVVRDGDDSVQDHRRTVHSVGQCGRTIVRLLKEGEAGVRIPRTLGIAEFWYLVELSLGLAQSRSPLSALVYTT